MELDIEAKEEQRWGVYRGDKDLWDRYSHATIKGRFGRWSAFYPIASFYRYDGDFAINFHGEGGSWPMVKPEDLKKKFLFIDRKTGKECTFKEPKRKPLRETVFELLDADSSMDGKRFLYLIKRLGFTETQQEIEAHAKAWREQRGGVLI